MNTKKCDNCVTVMRSVSKEEYDLFRQNKLGLKFTNWGETHKSEGIGWCYFDVSNEAIEVIRNDLSRYGILFMNIPERRYNSSRMHHYVGRGYGYRADDGEFLDNISLDEMSSVVPLNAEDCISFELLTDY